jgi:hypothetical protein
MSAGAALDEHPASLSDALFPPGAALDGNPASKSDKNPASKSEAASVARLCGSDPLHVNCHDAVSTTFVSTPVMPMSAGAALDENPASMSEALFPRCSALDVNPASKSDALSPRGAALDENPASKSVKHPVSKSEALSPRALGVASVARSCAADPLHVSRHDAFGTPYASTSVIPMSAGAALDEHPASLSDALFPPGAALDGNPASKSDKNPASKHLTEARDGCCRCADLFERAFDPRIRYEDISKDMYGCQCEHASGRVAFDRLLYGLLDGSDLPGCGDLVISEITSRLSARLGHGWSGSMCDLRRVVEPVAAHIVRLLPRVAAACRDCSNCEEAQQLMTELWAALESSYRCERLAVSSGSCSA